MRRQVKFGLPVKFGPFGVDEFEIHRVSNLACFYKLSLMLRQISPSLDSQDCM
jgi:hypothetical protein